MHWKTKAHLLAVLSRMPLGERVYRRMQRIARTNRLNVSESLDRCVEVVHLAREAGYDSVGGTIVEIGTGWRPSLLGADRIITFDIHPWMTGSYLKETCQALDARIEDLAEKLHVDPQPMRARFEEARAAMIWSMRDSLLKSFRVDYRCPADATRSGLPDSSADLVCSSNVLEHVSRGLLAPLHAESARILRPGGLAVHRFNPGDHFATVDRRITSANFVQFSASEWRWYGGSGLAYHNRLRCPDHARLLQQAGFELVVTRVRHNERAARAIESGELPVHADFQQFSAHELAADYMWVVGRRRTCEGVAVTRNTVSRAALS
jgi:SAM-dependent methyltransferase